MTPDMFVNHQQVKECAQQQGGGSLPDVGSSLVRDALACVPSS